MRRAVLLAALTLSACTQAAHSGKAADTPAAEAGQRAREALAAQLHIAADDITISNVVARTWSDSSMGCGTRGSMAATVITEGYAVTATAKGRDYEVHVSGTNAIVCQGSGLLRREPPAVRSAGLDQLMEQARNDLAQRIGVAPASIRLRGFKPQQWPDSSLGCPQQSETIVVGPVDGFQLALMHAGRVYTYHTDRKSVRACPAIEAK